MTDNTQYNKTWLLRHGHLYGRIFQISNVVTGDSYIGVTKAPIKKRLYQCIAAANANMKGKIYDNIRAWGKECFEVKTLHECSPNDDIPKTLNKIIFKINPSLNKEIIIF